MRPALEKIPAAIVEAQSIEVTGGIHGTNRLGSNADADACGMGYLCGIVVTTGESPDFIPAE